MNDWLDTNFTVYNALFFWVPWSLGAGVIFFMTCNWIKGLIPKKD